MITHYATRRVCPNHIATADGATCGATRTRGAICRVVRSPRIQFAQSRSYPAAANEPLVAIVCGSAGAGAAIRPRSGEAVKGAGNRPLAGGGAGFIYDRLTHKRKSVVEERQ